MGDNDFPLQFLQRFTKDKVYGQTGTDIPTFTVGSSAEGGAGTGFEPYYQEEIAASPSFDLGDPDIDSRQVDEWIRQNRALYGSPSVSPNVLRDAREVGRKIRMGQLKGV